MRKYDWTEELYGNIKKAQYNTTFRLKASSYDAIKLNGLELIDNPELKQQLFKVYEEQSDILKKRESMIEGTREYYHTWIARNIMPDTIMQYRVKDFNSILNDSEFLGNLMRLQRDHVSLVRYANEFSLEIRNLQKMLEIAISQLKVGKPITYQGKKVVKFVLQGYDTAKDASLTGPVVQWQSDENKLEHQNGQWELDIELPPDHYLYQYFIDGELIHDLNNSDKLQNANDEKFFSIKYVPYQ